MDVKIRNLDPLLIRKIDELAIKQRISRQSFLKNVIENFAVCEGFSEHENKYLDVIEKLFLVLERNTVALCKVNEIIEVLDEDEPI